MVDTYIVYIIYVVLVFNIYCIVFKYIVFIFIHIILRQYISKLNEIQAPCVFQSKVWQEKHIVKQATGRIIVKENDDYLYNSPPIHNKIKENTKSVCISLQPTKCGKKRS